MGDDSLRPGWMIRGAPVEVCAVAAAKRDLFSVGSNGQEQPISPMTPHFIDVSPTPSVSSLTMV